MSAEESRQRSPALCCTMLIFTSMNTSPIFAVAVIPEAATMAEAAAMELAVSSGLVRDGYQLLKSGAGKLTKWVDRAKGLKILKNLPKGPLEAFVFGEDDMTPELLAALYLGGEPGIQLSMIALVKANIVGHDFFDLCMDIPPEMDTEETYTGSWAKSTWSSPWSKEVPKEIFTLGCSRMDGEIHSFEVLDIDSPGVEMRVHLPGDDQSSGLEMLSSILEVVAVADSKPGEWNPGEFRTWYADGLVVRSPGDGVCYYCENRRGKLMLSGIDVPMSLSGINSSNPNTLLVSPRVLNEYSCFQRFCKMASFAFYESKNGLAQLLGLRKVVEELGEEFRAQIAGDGTPLLSKQHLRDVHNNPRRCTPTLRMPTEEELRTRVEEATASLTLHDRDAGFLFFGPMQKLISDFVKNIEREAARPCNVGVQPYKKSEDSNLIESCIVEAAGMDATFAIFEGFRKHHLNIAVSPGCTAVYFPGLSLTVAFPEGFEVQSRSLFLRPACPFTRDFHESLPILLGLAPRMAKNIFAKFAKTLSSELAKDPALVLSPVTEAVVRALSPRGRACDALYLTDLFEYLNEHNPESAWGEASVAGILSQLGVTFSLPPRREGCEVQDFRCFFQVCRKVWPSTCSGAELFVDCGVDISVCRAVERWGVKEGERTATLSFFLEAFMPHNLEDRTCKRHYEVTGVRWDDELRGCVGFLRQTHLYQSFQTKFSKKKELGRIPVRCRVIGYGNVTAAWYDSDK